jgi:F420-non-reducing hydrogenase small subunit
MERAARLQIALYWGAACGGCDVAVLDTDEFVLELAALADIRFWPIATDAKYRDVEAMADGELDASLVSGAVRNSENERVARLLRRKSRLLIAFGSCAALGGIPALANLASRDEILRAAYLEGPSLEPGNRTLPSPRSGVNGRSLELPEFYRRVYRLADVVPVDYVVPGCPPAPVRVRQVLEALASGVLPARGSVLGALDRALCDECPRLKEEKSVERYRRPYEFRPDASRCLLEQGLVCAGPATRGGCGARCPRSGMPCRGCYGPLPGVPDQGAKLVAALGSIVTARDAAGVEHALQQVPDVAGYAYRFSLAGSLLERKAR